MRKDVPIIAALSLIKVSIHLIGNRNYGFHRDELLHLSVAQHPAFGYMEFPPFIAWIGKLAIMIFGYSLSGIRIFATAAGVGILILCCLLAKEFGGKKHAVFLAGTVVLAFIPFYRNHLLFQPVAFDQLFWTLGFYWLVRYVNTQNIKYLIYLGITAGFGLMNKYTFLVWGIGVCAGLFFYDKGRIFRNKWIYVAALIAFLIFLPNIIWQCQHDFPIVLHLSKLKESQLDQLNVYDFVLDQVKMPFTFIFSMIGLFVLLFQKRFKPYRFVGVAAVVIFMMMWGMQSKAYYLFAIYPVLFAAGSVKTEQLLARRSRWNYAVAIVLLFPIFFYLPKAIPVLSIESFVSYADLSADKNGRIKLTDDYADMFGWTEQVHLLDSVYRSLSAKDQRNCMILASNYGEAGAIKILGSQYGLPEPVCANGSFWLWGTGPTNGNLTLTIGIEKDELAQFFGDYRLVKTLNHPYAIEEENGISVYICREPKVDIRKMWPTLEKHVFD